MLLIQNLHVVNMSKTIVKIGCSKNIPHGSWPWILIQVLPALWQILAATCIFIRFFFLLVFKLKKKEWRFPEPQSVHRTPYISTTKVAKMWIIVYTDSMLCWLLFPITAMTSFAIKNTPKFFPVDVRLSLYSRKSLQHPQSSPSNTMEVIVTQPS